MNKNISKLKIGLIISSFILILANTAYSQDEAEVDLSVSIVSAGLKPKTLNEAETNITIINNEQIKEAQTQDIAEILNREAGLDITRQPSLGNARILSIRGVTAQQVLILLNGCPLNSPSLGQFDLSQITLENVDRIEIIRGASSSVYGANAVGGVVNIITKEPKEKKLQTGIDVFKGSFNTQTYRFSLGAKPGKVDYQVAASRTFSDGWRKNNDYENNALSLHLGYDLSNLDHLKIDDQYYRGRLGVPGASYIPIDQWNDSAEREASSPNSRQEDFYNLLSAQYQRNFTENITTKIKPYYKESKQIFRDKNIFFGDTDNSIRTYTGGIIAQLDLVTDWSVGGEYRQDKVASRNNDLGSDVLNKSISFKSLFVQYSKNVAQLYSTLGLRYDDYSIFSGQLTPRASFAYIFNPQWKTSLNISRGYRTPTLNDLYWPEDFFTKGNKDLKPEKTNSFDLGVENNLLDIWKSKVTVFYILSQDLIQWAPDATTKWTPQNIAKAKNIGAEIELSHNLSKKLTQRLAYTAMNVAGKQEDSPDYLWLAFRPKHRLNYTATYAPLNTFKIDLNSQWIGKSFEQDGEKGLKIPSYTIWNADFSKKINTVIFFFKIENIFKRRYASRTDGFGNFYPLPSRTFWAGVNFYFND